MQQQIVKMTDLALAAEDLNATSSQSQEGETNSGITGNEQFRDDDDDDDVDTIGDDSLAKANSSTGHDEDEGEPQDEYQQMHALALKETRRINKLRFLVVTIILCVGAALSVFTYIILKRQNEQDAKDSFKLFASTVEENWKFRISTIFSSSRALSRSITTSAFTSVEKFPYFSVPAWEAKAFESRIQAGFETVTYAPINSNRKRWLNFTQRTRHWLDESKFIYDDLEEEEEEEEPASSSSSNNSTRPLRREEPTTPPLPDIVWDYDNTKQDGSLVERQRDGIMVTSLHVSPPPLPSVQIYQNINMFSNPDYRAVSNACVKLKDAVFSAFSDVLIDITDQLIGVQPDRFLYPHSIAAQPVYRGLASDADDVVGYIYSVVAWDRYLHALLPESVVGILVVLRNSCGQAVTFTVQGEKAIVLAATDIHDPRYEDQVVRLDFAENYFDPALTSEVEGHCQVFLDVYPSREFDKSFDTRLPTALTIMVASLFLIMAAVFFLYDWFVQTRNEKVVGVAARSNAIVSSLFPTKVKERLMEDQLKRKGNNNNNNNNKGKAANATTSSKITSRLTSSTTNNNLRGFLSSREEQLQASHLAGSFLKTPPIADFYPETSILFSDIAGFTAWSSSREPGQVFMLLETIYHQFDSIAKRRKIFKVETIGDCYVAVCGLPDARKDHAVAMCRFAKEAMQATWRLTTELTLTLGPDTNDLTMRMGIHSGPVTAGVLRGEKGRFQLFGDTMNTASRMESNGCGSRIQISQQTADLLIAAGKSNWFKPREDKITAKGKGELQTYWLNTGDSSDTASNMTLSSDDMGIDDHHLHHHQGKRTTRKPTTRAPDGTILESDKHSRLISWNVEVLCPVLEKIVGYRKAQRKKRTRRQSRNFGSGEILLLDDQGEATSHQPTMVLDEVREVICFEDFHAEEMGDPSLIELSPQVLEQLKSFVTRVVDTYNDHPFHCFDHASHVSMSVQKLLARIASADSDKDGIERSVETLNHDIAHCISNPLTQFACLLSGMIHDVDHPGVPNSQLVKEGNPIAERYKGRSVAEQNSVDIAWDLLMKDEYEELRNTIYSNENEKELFRSVVVNSVMATDIMDPLLKQKRNQRWDKAFNDTTSNVNPKESRDRKATIVIEHLIQASDVSHTMQHWHIFRKWNEKLFREMYRAYLDGRAEKDPGEFWYEGEIGFFEFYIIPLAKKLKECGVFGVSSDEYLNYAEQNLAEWKARGEQVVAEMISRVNEDYS